jgi:hypothetical protein
MDFKIVDFAKEKPRPQLVAVLLYKNLGKSRINITKVPEVWVHHPDGEKFGPYSMLPPELDAAQLFIGLEPLGVRDQTYMIPDLEQAIASGQLSDIRSRPSQIGFDVRITPTEGSFQQSFVGMDLLDSSLIFK